MRSWTIALMLGCACLNVFSILPSGRLIILILLVLAGLFWLTFSSKISVFFSFLFFMMIGLGYADLYARHLLQYSLPKGQEGKTVIVTGLITSVPDINADHVIFNFKINKIGNITQVIPAQLAWYQPYPTLHIGEQWQLLVHIHSPHGFANPGSFDYEAYLLAQDDRAIGYVRNGKLNKLLTMSHGYSIDHIRQKIALVLDQNFSGNPFLGMIKALTIGERGQISTSQWQVFSHTGTNHLMVVAGLHMGLCAWLMYQLVVWLWSRVPIAVLYIPAPQMAAVAALVAAVFYSSLAGFSIPTQRALVMIAVFCFTKLSMRNIAIGGAYGLALSAVLLLDPLATLSMGFWLSFYAVGLLIYSIVGRGLRVSRLWEWVKPQWVLGIGLIPITAWFFASVSWVAIIANMIAIPWIGLLVEPLSMFGVLIYPCCKLAGIAILKLALWLLSLLWPILCWFAKPIWATGAIAIPKIGLLMSSVLGALWLLAPKGFPARYLAWLLFLPFVFYQPVKPQSGDFNLTLLDVGQGLASVITTHQHVLIYDTGARFSPSSDAGTAVILPFLLQQAITHVDVLLISHGDMDHIGGADTLLHNLRIDKVITSAPQLFKGSNIVTCLAGMHWQWDGVDFDMLYPTKALLGQDNNSSCVLRITAGSKHVLLTGDIEKDAENYLVAKGKRELPANIIVAPHHGSSSSSSKNFVNAVQPRYVLFPVGYLNRYHFPNVTVLKRYQSLSAQGFQTDTCGAITITVSAFLPLKAPQCYRQDHQHYWDTK